MGRRFQAICEQKLREEVTRQYKKANQHAVESIDAWVEEHGLPRERYRLFLKRPTLRCGNVASVLLRGQHRPMPQFQHRQMAANQPGRRRSPILNQCLRHRFCNARSRAIG
ncbi:MAG: hypothetical protein B7Y47_09025 [Sphingomonas sp. 28-63-12]|nr:MAG: hypothetical protein B7Y47_09025 [Sphingomonas sp. 28-63-12]